MNLFNFQRTFLLRSLSRPMVLCVIILLANLTYSCSEQESQTGKLKADKTLTNPIIPGYFADPFIVEHEGTIVTVS